MNTRKAVIILLLLAAVLGAWGKSVQAAYNKGRVDLHGELLELWKTENGEYSEAPLLVPSPWIPTGNFDNIDSKNYRRGDL